MNSTAILTCGMSPSRALLQRALNVCLIGFMLISFRINIKLCQMISVHPCLSCQSPEILVSREKGEEENLSGFRQSLKLTLAKGFSVIPPTSLQLVPAASLLQLSPCSERRPPWQRRAGRTALLHHAKSSVLYKQLSGYNNAFSQKNLI